MRTVGPMCWHMCALYESSGPKRRFVLLSKDVYPGLWKVRQTAGVVQMKVRKHDVPNISNVKSQASDVVSGSLLNIQTGPDHPTEKAHESCRAGAILNAEPRIHENETIVSLYQQTVCYCLQCRESWKQRTAIQVMDLQLPCLIVWFGPTHSLGDRPSVLLSPEAIVAVARDLRNYASG